MNEEDNSKKDDAGASGSGDAQAGEAGRTLDVTSDIPGSGKIIELAKQGKVAKISPLVQEFCRLQDQLQHVENDLLNCNNLAAIPELQQRLHRKGRDFETEFRGYMQRLEMRKTDLRSRLAEVKARISAEEPGFAEVLSNSPPPLNYGLTTSGKLVGRPGQPEVASRNTIIDRCLDQHLTAKDTCKKLDLEFSRPGSRPEQMPERWEKDFGVKSFVQAYDHPECRRRVKKMISARRKSGRQLP